MRAGNWSWPLELKKKIPPSCLRGSACDATVRDIRPQSAFNVSTRTRIYLFLLSVFLLDPISFPPLSRSKPGPLSQFSFFEQYLRALPESLDSTLGRWTLYNRPNGEASHLLAEIYIEIRVRALAIFHSWDLRNLICSSWLLSKRFII